MLRLKTKFDASPLTRRLKNLLDLDVTQVGEQAGDLAAKQAQRRIKTTKRTPTGGRWIPWSPRYAKWRKHNAPRGGKLWLTGKLHKSLQTHEVTAIARGAKIVVGSDLVYAGRNQAQRPYLGLGPSDRMAHRSLLTGALKRAMK